MKQMFMFTLLSGRDLFKKKIISLPALGLSCGMQYLQLRYVGSSSLTRDQTQASYVGNMKS